MTPLARTLGAIAFLLCASSAMLSACQSDPEAAAPGTDAGGSTPPGTSGGAPDPAGDDDADPPLLPPNLDGGTPLLPIEAACRQIADARAEVRAACGGGTADSDADRERDLAECLEQAAAPGSGVTVETVAACAASLVPPASCGRNALTGTDPACHPPGTLADALACTFDQQCLHGRCANVSGGPCGVCVTPGLLGETCADRGCGPHLACTGTNAANEAACEPLRALNAACDTGHFCDDALCVEGICTQYSGLGACVVDVYGTQAPCAPGARRYGSGATCACEYPSNVGEACDLSNSGTARYKTCAAGLYCAVPPDPDGAPANTTGTCAPTQTVLGAPCEHRMDTGYATTFDHAAPACGEGLLCDATQHASGHCVAVPPLGAPCIEYQCGPHARCFSAKMSTNFTCIAAGAESQICALDRPSGTWSCDPGLWCTGKTGNCIHPPVAGEPCSGLNCAPGFVCDSSVSGGICVDPPAPGQPCVNGGQCGLGNTCDAQDPESPVCHPLAAVGEPCKDLSPRIDCAQGLYCSHPSGVYVGVCATPAALGEGCGLGTSGYVPACSNYLRCIPADDAGAGTCAVACGP